MELSPAMMDFLKASPVLALCVIVLVVLRDIRAILDSMNRKLARIEVRQDDEREEGEPATVVRDQRLARIGKRAVTQPRGVRVSDAPPTIGRTITVESERDDG